MKHEGARTVVGKHRAQRRSDRVAADLCAHHAAPRAAGHDRPVCPHERDMSLAPGRQRRFAARVPSIGEQQLGAVTGALACRGVDLVAIAELVDEARLARLDRGARAGVDQFANTRGVDAASAGDGVDRVVEDRLRDAICGLMVRVGELGAHDPVRSVLVLVTLLELGLDAELVEDAAQECRFGRDAEQSQPAAGLQPDLVERRGEDVRGHVA